MVLFKFCCCCSDPKSSTETRGPKYFFLVIDQIEYKQGDTGSGEILVIMNNVFCEDIMLERNCQNQTFKTKKE